MRKQCTSMHVINVPRTKTKTNQRYRQKSRCNKNVVALDLLTKITFNLFSLSLFFKKNSRNNCKQIRSHAVCTNDKHFQIRTENECKKINSTHKVHIINVNKI